MFTSSPFVGILCNWSVAEWPSKHKSILSLSQIAGKKDPSCRGKQQ